MSGLVDLQSKIRPIILAGGLGTRLMPRTTYLPKPLLPVNGRPLLWYALNSLSATKMLLPKVVLDYKGELIRTYFEREHAEFCDLPGRSMAEAVLEVAENDNAEAFLGMSSDVLVPKHAIIEILKDYSKHIGQDIILFVKLEKPGHKKWEFIIKEDYLNDIIKNETQTNFERILLIMTRSSLLKISKILPRPISENTLQKDVKKFQTGWILILKLMLSADIKVHARMVDIPVCNINTPTDFENAEEFVKQHMLD